MATGIGTFGLIELQRIQPNRLNPRLEFQKQGLDELADSIRNVGLVEPVVVRPRDSGYEIVVGERRYRAAQQAGLERVPAIIRDFSDAEVLELNLIENIHREDLSAVEKGRTCLRLMQDFPHLYPSAAALARRLGFDESTVRDWMAVATQLPEETHRFIAPQTTSRRVPEGKVDWRTAERVARQIKEPERKVEVLKGLADERIHGIRARDVVRRVVREPEKSVHEVIREIEEEPAELPFRLRHMELILEGAKTQTSRKGLPDPKIRPGSVVYASVYEPKRAMLRVQSVERKRLGDFTEEDAHNEGGYTLEEFRRVWSEIHPEGWADEIPVYVIRFVRVREAN